MIRISETTFEESAPFCQGILVNPLERRLAIVSTLETPRTPFVDAIEKLWPTEVAQAARVVANRNPYGLLVTLIEKGRPQPELIRQEWPL